MLDIFAHVIISQIILLEVYLPQFILITFARYFLYTVNTIALCSVDLTVY